MKDKGKKKIMVINIEFQLRFFLIGKEEFIETGLNVNFGRYMNDQIGKDARGKDRVLEWAHEY